jgi:hypothetical protein
MLLVLALIWGAFLVWWLRSRAGGTFGDSVGTFRRHLRVLERAAPVTVRPANRLRGPQMVPAYRPPAGIQGPPPRVGQPARRGPVSSGDLRRRQALKRRRDVLFLLAVVVIATLLMAGATRSHALIVLQLVCDAVLAGYISLLVRLRNLAAERELKLTYMPRERTGRPVRHDTDTGEMPALGYGALGYGASRQRPAAAIRRPSPAGYGSGYGELAMGRAAN